MKPSIHRRSLLLAGGGLFLLPLLPACTRKSPLVIASHVFPGYELMFLARREGWLSDNITLLETGSATESMQAIAEGRAHGAALTLDEALRLRAAGHPLLVVLVFNISAGADQVIARPGINTPDDLRGKRIGAESSALGALMLDRLLRAAQLPVDAVEVVTLTIDQQLAAWRAGAVDAMVSFEPVAGQLLAENGTLIFDSRALPNTILDVLAILPQMAHKHATALRQLIAGHFRALHHMRANPVDAGYRMAHRLGLPGPQVQQAFRGLVMPDVAGNRALLAAGTGGVLDAAGTLAEVMRASGVLTQIPDMGYLVSDHFLPRVP